ncbi:MAG TPA: DUF533 domain-containing protein [Myxococcota bacterium]|nr:DUF533 domain-containing protein [Myxococcota bacterium]
MSVQAALRLSREHRLLLLRFVCAFAWADGRVLPEERALVARYVEKLGLDAQEAAQVRAWLERPPPPESVDPSAIPVEHRSVFLHALESVISVDGDVAPVERERLLALAKRLRRSD